MSQSPPCDIEGCEKPAAQKIGGLCVMHRMRKYRHGDPLFTMRTMRPHGEIQNLLQQAAESQTDECIIFPRTASGYLSVTVHGKAVTAAKGVWMLAHGDPGDAYILHSCNYGSGANGCINPHHLRLGTPGENIADTWADPRVTFNHRRGESHHSARLTETQVREIRRTHEAGGVTYTELAARYGVHKGTVRLIVLRKIWTHI